MVLISGFESRPHWRELSALHHCTTLPLLIQLTALQSLVTNFVFGCLHRTNFNNSTFESGKKRGLGVYAVGLSNLYLKHTNDVPTRHVKIG